jgi:leucyl/phenylalanyl-tRNA---protein transferase
MPVYQLPESIVFPSPDLAEEDGLLAIGGDLSLERLILAYENGIFPWYNPDQPMLWWSPPKRMLLYPGDFKTSKSLKKSIEKGGFEMRIDTEFNQTMAACGNVPRPTQDGTWISPEMLEAYTALYEQGYAHSFECWKDGQLVGGLYGVSLGRAFFGESMFSLVSDASKVAFHHLHEFILRHQFHFVDCQLHTNHLASLGAREIDRSVYLQELKAALAFPDLRQLWTKL